MSDTQQDIYRNDNKGLSAGSQSADLSRSGGTPEEQQTARDPAEPEGGGGGGVAEETPPEARSEPARADDTREEQAPAPSSAASGEDHAASSQSSQQTTADAGLDVDVSLRADYEWTDLNGGQHSRETAVGADVSTDNVVGLANESGQSSQSTSTPSGGMQGEGPVSHGLTDGLADGPLSPILDTGGLTSTVSSVSDLATGTLSGAVDSVGALGSAVGEDALGGVQDLATDLLGSTALPDLDTAGPSGGLLSEMFNGDLAVPELDVGIAGLDAPILGDGAGLLGGLDDDASDDGLGLIL